MTNDFKIHLLLTGLVMAVFIAIPSLDAWAGAKQPATVDGADLGQRPEGIGLAPGQTAPDGALLDLDGNSATLSEVIAGRNTLLVFYRGGWCPYCNFQIRELHNSTKQFSEAGITPVAISVDTVDQARKTRATYALAFPVLADPDRNVHRQFNVLADGGKRGQIAVPSVFVINKAGQIVWSHADKDYSRRPTSEQLLGVVKGLNLDQ